MDLSIVIVNWNVKDLLKKCLQSIYKANNDFALEVIVVDNASADGSVAMIKKEFPQVQLIVNQKNQGFAKANNQGIEKSSGQFILLLNPDTEVFADTLNDSLHFMRTHNDCGVMGCKILNTDGSIQPSIRRFPTLLPIILIFLKIPKIISRLKSIDSYLAVDFNYEKMQIAEQVMGAFMMIKKKVLNNVGLLDERFFIWFEEVDFCKRVWDAGYKIYYNPNIKIIHHGGQSFDQQKMIKRQKIFFKSAWSYFRKHSFIKK